FVEFFPVLLGLLPRNEFVEWGDVQDDAIVEIGHEMQVRRPSQFVLEVSQFGEEILLLLDFLIKPLRFLAGFSRCGLLAARSFESAGFQPNLWFDVVHHRFEEQVFVEPVVIQPKAVILLRGLKQPVDGGLAVALRVARDMVIPEASLIRFAEVVSQFPYADDFTGFLLDGSGSILPDDFENIPHPSNDVRLMLRVIDEDAIPVAAEGVAFGRPRQRQTVVALEHSRWVKSVTAQRGAATLARASRRC